MSYEYEEYVDLEALSQLDPRLQVLVDLGETGTDIMHGYLKHKIDECQEILADISEGDLKEYLQGYRDCLTDVYSMTYNLAFAINERAKQRG
jgi:hypothetical protein